MPSLCDPLDELLAALIGNLPQPLCDDDLVRFGKPGRGRRLLFEIRSRTSAIYRSIASVRPVRREAR